MGCEAWQSLLLAGKRHSPRCNRAQDRVVVPAHAFQYGPLADLRRWIAGLAPAVEANCAKPHNRAKKEIAHAT